jgi:hypothetical protein
VQPVFWFLETFTCHCTLLFVPCSYTYIIEHSFALKLMPFPISEIKWVWSNRVYVSSLMCYPILFVPLGGDVTLMPSVGVADLPCLQGEVWGAGTRCVATTTRRLTYSCYPPPATTADGLVLIDPPAKSINMKSGPPLAHLGCKFFPLFLWL